MSPQMINTPTGRTQQFSLVASSSGAWKTEQNIPATGDLLHMFGSLPDTAPKQHFSKGGNDNFLKAELLGEVSAAVDLTGDVPVEGLDRVFAAVAGQMSTQSVLDGTAYRKYWEPAVTNKTVCTVASRDTLNDGNGSSLIQVARSAILNHMTLEQKRTTPLHCSLKGIADRILFAPLINTAGGLAAMTYLSSRVVTDKYMAWMAAHGTGRQYGSFFLRKMSDETLQVSQDINNSLNTTPISISTVVPHGFSSGDVVTIAGHLVNTNANGTWRITRTSTSSFTLNDSVGNGVGGATGQAVQNFKGSTDEIFPDDFKFSIDSKMKGLPTFDRFINKPIIEDQPDYKVELAMASYAGDSIDPTNRVAQLLQTEMEAKATGVSSLYKLYCYWESPTLAGATNVHFSKLIEFPALAMRVANPHAANSGLEPIKLEGIAMQALVPAGGISTLLPYRMTDTNTWNTPAV